MEEVRYLDPKFLPDEDNYLEKRIQSWCENRRAQYKKLQEKNGVYIFMLEFAEKEDESQLKKQLEGFFFPKKITLKEKGDGKYFLAIRDNGQIQPLKDSETIRVFHGTDISNAIIAATKGLSGKEVVPRKYSYEFWNNRTGLFVTINFSQAKYFATNGNDSVILEFTTKMENLDRPVWGGDTHSYTAFGGISGQFYDRAERQAEKARQHNYAMASNYSYVRNSDSPSTVDFLTNNAEQQALYYGDLNPNMIKRYWVQEGNTFVPYTRREFLKKYKNYELHLDNERKQKHKLYYPSEDFDGIDGFEKRWDKENPNFKGAAKEFLNSAISNCFNGNLDSSVVNTLKLYMWPKQLQQFLDNNCGNNTYRDNVDSMYPEFRGKGKPW